MAAHPSGVSATPPSAEGRHYPLIKVIDEDKDKQLLRKTTFYSIGNRTKKPPKIVIGLFNRLTAHGLFIFFKSGDKCRGMPLGLQPNFLASPQQREVKAHLLTSDAS